jgi:hypothetical protein
MSASNRPQPSDGSGLIETTVVEEVVVEGDVVTVELDDAVVEEPALVAVGSLVVGGAAVVAAEVDGAAESPDPHAAARVAVTTSNTSHPGLTGIRLMTQAWPGCDGRTKCRTYRFARRGTRVLPALAARR